MTIPSGYLLPKDMTMKDVLRMTPTCWPARASIPSGLACRGKAWRGL